VTNGYLFNPGNLQPFVQSGTANNATFTAVMVLRDANQQPKLSENLSAQYSIGRLLTYNQKLSITPTATSTNATGLGAAAYVPDITQPTFTSSNLETQGGKHACSQEKLVDTGNGGQYKPAGIRCILGPNVLEELTPLDYALVGSGIGAKVYNIANFNIRATGVLGQAVDPSGSNTPAVWQNGNLQTVLQPAPFQANGYYDRQLDAFANVIWISDKFDCVDGTFYQTQQLSADRCQVGATGQAISNTYANSINQYVAFSKAVGTGFMPIKNFRIGLLNEDAPPIYKVRWVFGIGAGR